MVLRNHIAYRFLTDSNLWMEMLETQYPNIYKDYQAEGKDLPEGIMSLYYCLCNTKDHPYMVSQSVVENLDMLKINKKDDHYNWEVFKNLPELKATFIFHDNNLLRMIVSEETLWFCHLSFTFDKGDKNNGKSNWVMFYLNRKTGELCEHFNHTDVRNLEEFIYKFLCFFYLTENTEEIIPAGKIHGTRKTGKISNDFRFPITLVTSRWNTTTIRTESFGVRGHFRVQPCGKGRSNYEIIFIAPFTKQGYIRKAAKLTTQQNQLI